MTAISFVFGTRPLVVFSGLAVARRQACGTAVFGDDPQTSVLDTWCRTHDIANLFVVDASFFPSSASVNPALTIAAQALRAADHIKDTHLLITIIV